MTAIERGGAQVASSAARSYTCGSSVSWGTTAFTNPMAFASAASITRPENSRSQALAGPTSRGSIHELPCSLISPRRANAVVKRARSDAMRMS